MRFWVKDVRVTCQTCSRTATHEVMNSVNASQGRFCKMHAKHKATRLNKEAEKKKLKVERG